jgi:hypothetical protein
MGEYDFESGFMEAVRRLELVSDRPILAAVFGYPNSASGKSTLIKRIAEYFRSRGLYAADFGGGPTFDTFENIVRRGDTNWVQMYLFHCGWERSAEELQEGGISLGESEDPNVMAKKIGKRLHLNIGIYNPNTTPWELKGEYDLLIRNDFRVRQ